MRKVLLFSALLSNIWEKMKEGKNHSSEDNFQPYSSPQKSENPWAKPNPTHMSGTACQKIEMHKNHYYWIWLSFSPMTDPLNEFQ